VIDFNKAFNSVNHVILFQKLELQEYLNFFSEHSLIRNLSYFRSVVGSGLSSEHREVFCPSSARSRITYMFV